MPRQPYSHQEFSYPNLPEFDPPAPQATGDSARRPTLIILAAAGKISPEMALGVWAENARRITNYNYLQGRIATGQTDPNVQMNADFTVGENIALIGTYGSSLERSKSASGSDSGKATLLAGIVKNPQKILDALTLLNHLLSANVKVLPASSTRGVQSIVTSGTNTVVPIPLQFLAPIDDSAVVLSSVSSQLNLLLAAFRTTNQLPT